jgi:hypothetical protein
VGSAQIKLIPVRTLPYIFFSSDASAVLGRCSDQFH